MPATQPTKVCVVCGVDVAAKPRVKDAQGRYVCKGECEAKLASKAPATAKPTLKSSPAAGTTTSLGADDIMGSLLSASPVLSGKPCAACGSAMKAGAVVCTNCGTNVETGKKLKTAIIKEKEEKAPKVKGGSPTNRYASSSGPGFFKMLLYLSGGLSLVSLSVFGGPAGVLAGVVILMLAGLIAWIGCVVSAFRNDQMVLGLLMIFPFTAGIVMLLFNIFWNQDERSRALYWATFIAGIVFAVAMGAATAMGFNTNLGSTTLSPV